MTLVALSMNEHLTPDQYLECVKAYLDSKEHLLALLLQHARDVQKVNGNEAAIQYAMQCLPIVMML